eukprot:80908_1
MEKQSRDYSGVFLDRSGAVSLNSDGTIVAIGAYNNDGAGTNAGRVRVYKYNVNMWQQIGSDIDEKAADDYPLTYVSLNSDGTIVAIGAYGNDDAGNNAGHVRVYKYNVNMWQQIGSDIDEKAADDYPLTYVSLNSDGTIVAIGAHENDGAGTYAGHVRVYEYDGNMWQQIGSDIDGEASRDYSGVSVSLNSDGTIVAIGAYTNDGAGHNAGHVRVYLE